MALFLHACEVGVVHQLSKASTPFVCTAVALSGDTLSIIAIAVVSRAPTLQLNFWSDS